MKKWTVFLLLFLVFQLAVVFKADAATEISVSPTVVNSQPFDFSITIRDSKGLKNVNFDAFIITINDVDVTHDIFSNPNLKVVWNTEKEVTIIVPDIHLLDGVYSVNINTKNSKGKSMSFKGEIQVISDNINDKIGQNSATDWVMTRAWSMIKKGIAAEIIRAFFEAYGYTCYDKPWWVPMPTTYWYGLTCAKPVR